MVIRMGTDRETEVTETADQDTTKKTAGRREDSIRREYGFASDVELKECRYCRVMIPKKAKVCPNCRMSLKRHWFRNLAAAVFAVAVIGGGGFYLSEHWGIMRDAVMAVWMAQDGPAVPAVSVATVGVAETAAVAAAAETSEVSVKTEEAAGQDSDGKAAGTNASSGTVLQDNDGTYEEETGFPGAGPDRAAGRQNADTAGGQDVQEDGGSGDTVNGSNSVQDVSDGGRKGGNTSSNDVSGGNVSSGNASSNNASGGDTPGSNASGGNTSSSNAPGDNTSSDNASGGNTSSDNASGGNTSNRINGGRTEKQGTEEKPLDPLQAAEEPEEIEKDSLQKTEDIDSAADDAEDTDSAADDAEDTDSAADDAEDTDSAADDAEDTKNAVDDAEDTDNDGEEKKDTAADKNMDQEEKAFREDCITVGYKSLLRDNASYLDTALRVEVQVMCQVNGGLFDENIYYLCMFEDKSGIERYYIIRDDREEDDTLILEGDTLTVYGRLFGSCRLPAGLIETRPTVPAVSMLYYDLMEE